MDKKDMVINELKLYADMYENKLIELMGSDDFTLFAKDCTAKMLTVEAHNYIYGITEVMPKL